MNQPVTLNQLRQMPLGEVAALPASELARLQKEVAEAVSQTKLVSDLLNGVLARRFGDRATAIRQESGKEFGIVRFHEDGIELIADQKKEVSWDQGKLATIATRIAESGEDVSEYIKTTLTVDERKFSAWPLHIRDAFVDARTVRTGKQSFQFEKTV